MQPVNPPNKKAANFLHNIEMQQKVVFYINSKVPVLSDMSRTS